MTSIVAPVYKSIVRATTDLIEQLNSTGNFSEIEYQDWESRFDESNLPRKTLIGLDGFSFDENEGRWLISYGLAISSYHDVNLLNEIEMIDMIQQIQGEKKKIILREMVNGEEISQMVVTAWRMLPMAQSELRNYRTIGMELKRTEIIKHQ